MKYFSMFSGVGGFELGIQYAYEEIKLVERTTTTLPRGETSELKGGGWLWEYAPHCIGYSEIDKYAIQIYEKHFKHKNYGNATTINEKELPDFDLLVGGFPCQAFSIAGKRKGFDDTRGTLFFDIARILAHKRPRHFLLENVKGLLSHDGGKTFQTILGVLSDLGYLVEWQVLNSKNFGVPQNRERVFFVGHLGGECSGQVFPIGEADGTTNERFDEKNTEVASTLRSRYGNGTGSHLIAPTIRAEHHNTADVHFIPEARPVLTPDRPKKRQNGRRMKENGDPSFTLTGQDKHGVMIRDGRDNRSCLRAGRTPEVGYEGYSIRRLTPTECARLQGFPDNWHEGLSDTQAYKCYGNAVTVNVISHLIKRL